MSHNVEFFKSLKQYDEKEYLLRYLIYCTSAVITGIKPAELITLKNKECNCLDVWENHSEELKRQLKLSCFEMNKNKNSVSLLFYNEEHLTETLVKNQCSPIFKSLGYPTERGTLCMLMYLSSRFDTQNFPHEIGLFLGYSACDVEAFISNKAQGYCICGYWKVYHDIDEAKKKFKRITEVKSNVARMLLYLAAHKTIKILYSI